MQAKNTKKKYGRTFSLRLYGLDEERLKRLQGKLEMPWNLVIRQAVKALAKKEGVE